MAERDEPAFPSDTREDDAGHVRRQQFVTAAYELLDEAGLDGLTIRAVLKRTGLARRAFYERFTGKDDLVLAVFADTLKEAAAHFDRETAALRDPLEQIRAIVFGLVPGSQPHPDGDIGMGRMSAIVREHMRLAQTRPGELENALDPLLSVIADRISAGIRAGQVRDCDPELQATLIYNLIAGTVHLELLMEESGEPGHYRRQRLADDIWEFCRRAIVA